VKETLRTLDGSVVGPSAPSYVVESVDFMAVPNLLSLRLKVIDFDQAFPVSSPPSRPLGTPARCLSPEAIFDHEVGVASDVWALGCLIFKIRSGFELFASFGSSGPDYAVMQIVKTLGPLPKKWSSRKFDDDGYPVEDSDERIQDAEELEYEPFRALLLEAVREIEGDPNVSLAKNHDSLEAELWTPSYESTDMDGSSSTMRISREEVDLLFDLLLKIFKYSPEERLGLKEIADHPWFKVDI
jgi:serine/threonine-protein kinase SRPK3